MDANDASIRDQLLTVQNELLEAYQKGPEELVAFMESWSALKDRLVAAASAHLLSIETLQLAAEVARPVAAIAASLLNLNAVEAKISAELAGDSARHVELFRQSQDDDQLSEDGYSDFPANSEYLSDLEDDEDWEDPDAPKYCVLRDWFFDNIGHPFLDPAQDYEELLKEANVTSRDELLKWLEFVRTRSGWHRLFDTHARGSAHWMNKLCSQVLDELDLNLPRRESALPLVVRDDFRRFRLEVDRIYQLGLSEWWDEVNDMFAEAGYEPWSNPADDENWFSDEYVSADEEVESDSDTGSEVESETNIAIHCEDEEVDAPMTYSLTVVTSPARLVGTKRKAIEMTTGVPTGPVSVPATQQGDTEARGCKRRKLRHVQMQADETDLLSPSTGAASSASSPATSQSSHVSSSLSPSGSSMLDYEEAPSPQRRSSTPSTGNIQSPQEALSGSPLFCKSGASILGPPSISISARASSSIPNQVQGGPDLQAQFIRSNRAFSSSKRKRDAYPESAAPLAPREKSLNHPMLSLVKSISSFNKHTNRIYGRIHKVEEQELPTPSHSSCLDSRPRKRLREIHTLPSPVRSTDLRSPSPMDPRKDTPSDASHTKYLSGNALATSSVADEGVVQPLASAPPEQEATSLTTPSLGLECIDILSWISQGVGLTLKVEEYDHTNLQSPHASNHYIPDGVSSTPSSIHTSLRGARLDGPDNYASPYNSSTPGLNFPSPNETASTTSGEAQTPSSFPGSTRDTPLPELQATVPLCNSPLDSLLAPSYSEWEQALWKPKDEPLT